MDKDRSEDNNNGIPPHKPHNDSPDHNDDSSEIIFNIMNGSGKHDNNPKHSKINYVDDDHDIPIPPLPTGDGEDTSNTRAALIKVAITIAGTLLLVACIIVLTTFTSKSLTSLRQKMIDREVQIEDAIFDEPKPNIIALFVKPIIEKFSSSESDKHIIKLTEAEFSKIDFSKPFDLNESLSKINSAVLSTADRISKLECKQDQFRTELKELGLVRTNRNMNITIELANVDLNYDSISLNTANNLAQIKHLLAKGTTQEKYQAIDQLSTIGSYQANSILLTRITSLYDRHEKKSVINRIIQTICTSQDSKAMQQLADVIGQCPKQLLSHQISLVMSQSTQIQATDDAILPPQNEFTQRSKCSQWWKDKLDSMDTNSAADANDISTFWTSRSSALNSFANIAVLAQLCSEIMHDTNTNEQTQAADSEEKASESIPAASLNALASKSFAGIFTCLENKLRSNQNDSNIIIRLDMICLQRNAQLLACENALSEISVNLNSTAEVLHIMNELEQQKAFSKILEKLRDNRLDDLRNSRNVIDEIQIESYYILRELDLLIQQQEIKAADKNA